MDRVILKNLVFYGYHGDREEERRLGQRFIIDISLYRDLSLPARTDRLGDTIDYVAVYDTVKQIATGERHDLVERVAGRIVETLFERFGDLQRVVVQVKKPAAPIDGMMDYVGVELDRTRN